MTRKFGIVMIAATACLVLTACGKVRNVEQRPAAECKAWAEYETYDTITVDSIDEVPESAKAICLNGTEYLSCYDDYTEEERYYYTHVLNTMYDDELPATCCFEYIVNVSEDEEAEAFQKLSERDLTRAAVVEVDFENLDAFSRMEHLESLWISCANFEPKFEGTFPALIDLYVNMCNVDKLGDIPKITTLQRLTLNTTDIENAKGIEKLTNLSKLDLSDTHLRSLRPLATMTQLTSLNLSAQNRYKNRIQPDLQYLAGMQNLRSLGLGRNYNGLRHTEVLAELTSLENLCLLDCNIQSVEPLREMTNLRTLDLTANHVNDLEPLSGMTNMENLRLHNNEITDLSPLAGMTQMRVLTIGYNTNIIDISAISDMTLLEQLSAVGCGNLRMIDALQDKPNLKDLELSGAVSLESADVVSVLMSNQQLESLRLQAVELDDWGVLSNLASIRTLDVSHSKFNDISTITNLKQLQELDISHSDVQSLDGLAVLDKLEKLTISATDVDSVKELWNMDSLTYVEAESMRKVSDENLRTYKTHLEDQGGNCQVSPSLEPYS